MSVLGIKVMEVSLFLLQLTLAANWGNFSHKLATFTKFDFEHWCCTRLLFQDTLHSDSIKFYFPELVSCAFSCRCTEEAREDGRTHNPFPSSCPRSQMDKPCTNSQVSVCEMTGKLNETKQETGLTSLKSCFGSVVFSGIWIQMADQPMNQKTKIKNEQKQKNKVFPVLFSWIKRKECTIIDMCHLTCRGPRNGFTLAPDHGHKSGGERGFVLPGVVKCLREGEHRRNVAL